MKILLSVIFTSFLVISAVAQRELGVSGGEGQTEKGSISYTIGNAVQATYTTSNGTLTNGFQQGYPAKVIAVKNSNPVNNVRVYPNPTEAIINIDVPDFSGKHVKLTTISGKLIRQEELNQAVSTIDLIEYSKGIYLLEICGDVPEVRSTFKIVKK